MEGLFQKIEQVAFVVRDLPAAVRVLTEDLGVGPVIRVDFGHKERRKDSAFPAADVDQVYLDGKYTNTYAISLGCADLKMGVQLELIEPLEGPSIFQSYLDEHGPGIQHLSVDCPLGFETAIGRMGAAGNPLGQLARVDGQEDCAFIRHHGTLGADLELHRRDLDFHVPEAMPPVIQPDRSKHPVPLVDAVAGVSFATGDLDRLLDLLHSRYGIGPWSLTETADGIRRAVCRSLNTVLELMEPMRLGVSLDRWLGLYGGPGVPYLTLHCPGALEDVVESLRSAGRTVVHEERRRAAFADFTDPLGVFLRFTDRDDP